MNELTTEKKSLLVTIASKYGMDADVFKNVIMKTIMPSGTTNEQLAAFLMVADRYGLNPVIKEIHAFPSKKGGIEPMVGIDGFYSIANRHPAFDGIDFEYSDDSITCIVYRKDRQHPVRVTEFMDECKRNTIPWQTHPKRMLRHKAAIQAIRCAFGFSGIYDEDDLQAMEVVVSQPSINEQVKKSLPAARWPEQRDEKWFDSRGVEFNAELHGMTRDKIPSVTAAGHFRKKRDCDETAFAEYERQQLAPEKDPPWEASFERIEEAIRHAKDEDELVAAEDLLNSFKGDDDQIKALNDHIATARQAMEESG